MLSLEFPLSTEHLPRIGEDAIAKEHSFAPEPSLTLRYGKITISYNHQAPYSRSKYICESHQIILMLDETSEADFSWRDSDNSKTRQYLKGQHIIFIESGINHTLQSSNNTPIIGLLVDNHFLKQLSLQKTWAGVKIRRCHELAKGDLLIWQLSYIIKNLCEQKTPQESPLYMEAIGIILATHLLRMQKLESYPASAEPGLLPPQMRKVHAYIAAHLCENITVPRLAQEAAMSKDHFTKLFKNTIGVTPHRYILLKRLRRAQELITKGEMRLVDIALATGFCDQSHLSRYFRKFCSELARENADLLVKQHIP
jgi:AraC family transcriptional regulator